MFSNRTSSGKHLIVDIPNIDIEINLEAMITFMDFVVDSLNLTVLNSMSHIFDDDGKAFTILYLLSESHMSLHSFPEKNYIAFDLYSCRQYRDNSIYEQFVRIMNSYFRTVVSYKIIDRKFLKNI